MTDIYTIVNRAKDLGYLIEIFMTKVNEIQIKREKQFQNMRILDRGYGIRIIKEGKMGFAYGNRLDNLLDLAIDSLNAAKADKFNTIPSPEKIQKQNLMMFNINEAEDKIKDLMGFGSELREYVNVVSEYYEAINLKVKIVNSEGIDVEEERSLLSFSLAYNIKNDNEISPEIYEFLSSRTLKLDIEKLKEKVLKTREIYSKDRIKLEKPISRAEFTPKSLVELFSPLFSHAISLENYVRGKSPLNEGEMINSSLEIFDNPFIDKAPYSRSFDGEGLPSRTNFIIKEGKVNQFLSNTYWSLKAGKDNTHSASRSYSTIPFISPTIIDVNVKSSTESEGIVIDQVQGVHTSNFDTGEFSVVASVAWNEKEGKAFRELTLSGNLKDFLKGIEGKTSDKVIYGNLNTPSLVVKSVNIM